MAGYYMAVAPAGFEEPKLLLFNAPLAQELQLPDLPPTTWARITTGSQIPEDATPLAQVYAGHQFGGYSPQLGDGRALLLGELLTVHGSRVDFQLKGAGPTPFSRGGDGFAALGPVLREYLVSEAMHHLGVATTRMLAVALTGQYVYRDVPPPGGRFRGGTLARIAASHLRIGTVEFFAARGDRERVEQLVSYVLQRHYPELTTSPNPAGALLDKVAERQASLIAQWMSVGFVHGVMNTDNVSLCGETLDYGPCAFLDTYDPHAVFSSIDRGGRYAFGQQPRIGAWNLARLGEALLPLLAADERVALAQIQDTLKSYEQRVNEAMVVQFRSKLGLRDAREGDEELISDLLTWMAQASADFTLTFRSLATSLRNGTQPFQDAAFSEWFGRYLERLGAEPRAAVAARMDAINPLYIPRNHLVEAALTEAYEDNLAPLKELLTVLASPYEAQDKYKRFAEPPAADAAPHRTYCGT